MPMVLALMSNIYGDDSIVADATETLTTVFRGLKAAAKLMSTLRVENSRRSPSRSESTEKQQTAISRTTAAVSNYLLFMINDLLSSAYPQLLRVIEHCWKDHFEEIVRDKALIQEARHILAKYSLPHVEYY
jgi:hypothetical protein